MTDIFAPFVGRKGRERSERGMAGGAGLASTVNRMERSEETHLVTEAQAVRCLGYTRNECREPFASTPILRPLPIYQPDDVRIHLQRLLVTRLPSRINPHHTAVDGRYTDEALFGEYDV